MTGLALIAPTSEYTEMITPVSAGMGDIFD